MFALATAVYVLVLALLAVPIVRSLRRRSRVDPTVNDEEPRHWGIWAGGVVMPAIVLLTLLALSVPVALTNLQDRAVGQDVRVEVTGHQFWWEVRYPHADVITANEIRIPVGQSVELAVTSADVIHSFWVPPLAGKVDLTPGSETFITLRADESGTYRGQCAEFCGLAHAQMAMRVVAEQPAAFDRWLTEQSRPAAPPSDETARAGRAVFSRSCAECHTIRGHGATGDVGPDLTHLASRETIAAGTLPNTVGHLGGWIMNPQELKPGNRMPPANLSGDELQALLDYLGGLE